ncbi:Lethal(3)malignant brain tumor-like protein 1 [Ataeniobius toweri]|uniref:Lethal(3)malignant brain tumor-like protein 1 n=1 Tax=Ataeniobius toweri TaxID=208326 RepID=A0ABU7BKK6_9TELE|nr:Lethal(3)malignant brain tumor-like protein 1 [Ataeniobius toweri]
MSSEGMYPSLFMSALSGQSDRTLSLCWEQHCKLLPGVQGIHASQVATWSVDEVFRFVQNLIGCEEQARLFKEEAGFWSRRKIQWRKAGRCGNSTP